MRMIYNNKTLKPEFLISDDFDVAEVGAEFWVINGDWYGVWLGDTFKVVETGRVNPDAYSIYSFKSKPPEDYFNLLCVHEDRVGVNYEAWFAHFDDLVKEGVIYE